MTLDTTVHLGELLVLAGAAVTIFKGGVNLRDAVRDLTNATIQLRESYNDHERRIRTLEFGERRSAERRHS